MSHGAVTPGANLPVRDGELLLFELKRAGLFARGRES